MTDHVMWEQKGRKEQEAAVMEHAEQQTGLNFSSFTLKVISFTTKGDGRSRLVVYSASKTMTRKRMLQGVMVERRQEQ